MNNLNSLVQVKLYDFSKACCLYKDAVNRHRKEAVMKLYEEHLRSYNFWKAYRARPWYAKLDLVLRFSTYPFVGYTDEDVTFDAWKKSQEEHPYVVLTSYWFANNIRRKELKMCDVVLQDRNRTGFDVYIEKLFVDANIYYNITNMII